jgi:hypothetical protein
MAAIIDINTNSPPVIPLLSEQENNLVALISNSLVNYTLKQYEEGNRIPQVQHRRSEQQQYREAGNDHQTLVPA